MLKTLLLYGCDPTQKNELNQLAVVHVCLKLNCSQENKEEMVRLLSMGRFVQQYLKDRDYPLIRTLNEKDLTQFLVTINPALVAIFQNNRINSGERVMQLTEKQLEMMNVPLGDALELLSRIEKEKNLALK